MQVVYSGGSSTPTPSPRLQRKQPQQGYGRPVLPGYITGAPPHSTTHRAVVKDKPTEEPESSLRDAIPAMRKNVAVLCLVLNIILPGLGTFVSGLTALCSSRVRLKSMTRKKVVWVNTWVALLQFITAFLFLLGWIWSVVWGAAFVSISADYYETGKEKVEGRSSNKTLVDEEAFEAPRSNVLETMTYHVEPRRRPNIPESCNQPIIVLQEAPVGASLESATSPSRPIMDARTRHQKILRRQMSDNELSPFNLTQARLHDIVVYNTPIPNAMFDEENNSSVPSTSNGRK